MPTLSCSNSFSVDPDLRLDLQLAYSNETGIYVTTADMREQDWICSSAYAASPVTWSDDGARLFAIGGNGSLVNVFFGQAKRPRSIHVFERPWTDLKYCTPTVFRMWWSSRAGCLVCVAALGGAQSSNSVLTVSSNGSSAEILFHGQKSSIRDWHFVSTNHKDVLFFCDKGRLYSIDVCDGLTTSYSVDAQRLCAVSPDAMAALIKTRNESEEIYKVNLSGLAAADDGQLCAQGEDAM